MRRQTVLLAVVTFALGFAQPARALGATPAAKRIGQLNLEALEQYDLLEFEAAKAKLLEAVKLANDEGLTEDPVVAKTYLHLAAVYIGGYKDSAKGMEAMLKGLRIDPTVKMTPSIRNKMVLSTYDRARAELAREKAELEAKIAASKKERAEREAAEKARVEKMLAEKAAARRAREEASRKAGEEQVAASRAKSEPRPSASAGDKIAADDKGGDKGGDKDKTPAGWADTLEPDAVEGLKCPAATELPPRRPLALRCALEKTVDAAAVFVFFRPVGREEFVPQLMKRSPKGWYEAVIAPEMIMTPGIEVYFEARDKKGRPLAADGNASEPKVLNVRSASALLHQGRIMARP